MKNKKAQMKIQQMAFMLIAVFIFFALVAMAVLAFKLSGLKESASLLEEKNALLLVTKLANSPEFSCGESFGEKKTNCIDMDKTIVLRDNLVRYVNFWGVSDIEIRRVYPSSTSDVLCNIENYPNCNVLKLRSSELSGTGIGNFVALCRKSNGENICELGKIILNYESK